MADFQYEDSGVWADVPDHAYPDDEGSITVQYPEATDRDPNNKPCGAFGSPMLVIQATWMTGTGWAWWQAFFANATDLTATLEGITGFNPRSGAWVKYTGTLHRPVGVVKPAATAGRTVYEDVTIIVDDLAETT